MDYIEHYIKEKSVNGKIALSDSYDFLKTRFNIPVRTFQWYVQEGLLPRPDMQGKNGFYPDDVALEVLEKARLIKEMKKYSVIKFSTIKSIFDNYRERRLKLIEALTNLIEQFPPFERGSDPDEPVFSWENAEVVKRVCERMRRGVQLEEISAVSIEKGISSEG